MYFIRKILFVPKAKIINFELLYLNSSNYTDQQISDVNFKIISEEIRQAAKHGCDTIFGLLLLDGFLYKGNEIFFNWLRSIEAVGYDSGIKHLIIVPGMCEDFENDLRQHGIKASIEYFDFTHRMVYNSYRDKIDLLHPWNFNADQFLFLGGIPSRANRIRLLSKFYQTGMLSKCQWSFFKPFTDNDKDICRSLMWDYSDSQYYDFIDICERSIDNLYNDAQEYSRLNGQDLIRKKIYQKTWLKDPSWIDPTVFNTTKFSIISEGNAYPPATSYKFLTEKTWRTVVNRHPFIIAGHPDQIAYANQRGLVTFENHMLSNFYNDEEELRFDSIVDNAKHWLMNLDPIKVNDEVEKNYRRFFEIAQEQDLWFDRLIKNYQIESNEIDHWFNQLGFSHLIRIPDGD
jgi:hypothetical protein